MGVFRREYLFFFEGVWDSYRGSEIWGEVWGVSGFLGNYEGRECREELRII